MDLKDRARICLCQLAFEVAFADLQLLELRPDAARVAVTVQNEGQGPIDAASDLIQVFLQGCAVVFPIAAQTLHLFSEAGRELCDQVLAPKEDLLQRGEDAGFEF
ncbi:MAG: hypothetical protein O9292_04415 [Rhodobacteraceae bacterium]|nr:hypothetical protein [Paracoccaceae bacterium]